LVNVFVGFVSLGDPSWRMFDDGAGMHKYSDSRMSPNLLSGTGKSIDGDLDVDDEGSK
jgi:hypothetical protein